jgi:cell cycle serine/threonine-protein kinase CDC5/MSD2
VLPNIALVLVVGFVVLIAHHHRQFNFYDHTKIILSSSGMMITHIDKNYALTRWPLSQVMALSFPTSASSSSSSASEKEHEEARFQQKLLDKLRYCKEVLGGIKTASGEEMAGLNLKRTASQATIR